MTSMANRLGSSTRSVLRGMARIVAASVLAVAAVPAHAGFGPIVPSLTFTTVFVPQYSLTCPPQLLQFSVTSLSSVTGPFSTTFYRTVGVSLRLQSPAGFVTVVPSNQQYNQIPVAGSSSTIIVSATENFPVKGVYQATGTHLFIRSSGDSIVQQTRTSLTN